MARYVAFVTIAGRVVGSWLGRFHQCDYERGSTGANKALFCCGMFFFGLPGHVTRDGSEVKGATQEEENAPRQRTYYRSTDHRDCTRALN